MKAMSIRARTLAAVVCAALSTACASNTAHRPARDFERSGLSASLVITLPELLRVASGQSLMTAVERARPWFLSARGSVPTVSIDGSPSVELSILRMLHVSQVQEVRLLRSGGSGMHPAILPNGHVVVGDVILVLTRKG